jgi:hypothetical protein
MLQSGNAFFNSATLCPHPTTNKPITIEISTFIA